MKLNQLYLIESQEYDIGDRYNKLLGNEKAAKCLRDIISEYEQSNMSVFSFSDISKICNIGEEELQIIISALVDFDFLYDFQNKYRLNRQMVDSLIVLGVVNKEPGEKLSLAK